MEADSCYHIQYYGQAGESKDGNGLLTIASNQRYLIHVANLRTRGMFVPQLSCSWSATGTIIDTIVVYKGSPIGELWYGIDYSESCSTQRRGPSLLVVHGCAKGTRINLCVPRYSLECLYLIPSLLWEKYSVLLLVSNHYIFTMSTNHAAFLTQPMSRPLVVGDAPFPTPNEDEIVVKNAYVGINGVDYKLQEFDWMNMKYPTILGAEVAGKVVAVGPLAKEFQVGDRVIGFVLN